MAGRLIDPAVRAAVLAEARTREHPGGPARHPLPAIAARTGVSVTTVRRVLDDALNRGLPIPHTRRGGDGKLHPTRRRPWPPPPPPPTISRTRRIAGGDALGATAPPFAGILGPDLPNAACRGRAPIFDDQLDGETPDDRTARHQLAVQVCQQCPALTRCAVVEAGLPRDVRGVWAGHVRGRGRAA